MNIKHLWFVLLLVILYCLVVKEKLAVISQFSFFLELNTPHVVLPKNLKQNFPTLKQYFS